MDNINNNNNNSFKYPVQDSLNTARITPYLHYNDSTISSASFTIDSRMKDRQIAILMSKNKQLALDLQAYQQQQQNYFNQPSYNNTYWPSDNTYSHNGWEMQSRLLMTALQEKNEELRQAREEHDLVMMERSSVHKDLRDQAREIEMLRDQLQQQRNTKMGYWDSQLCKELKDQLDKSQAQSSSIQKQLRDKEAECRLMSHKLDLIIAKCHSLRLNLDANNTQYSAANSLMTPGKHTHHQRHQSTINSTSSASSSSPLHHTDSVQLSSTLLASSANPASSIVPSANRDQPYDIIYGQVASRDVQLYLLGLPTMYSELASNALDTPSNDIRLTLRPSSDDNAGDVLLQINNVDVIQWSYDRICRYLDELAQNQVQICIKRPRQSLASISQGPSDVCEVAIASLDTQPKQTIQQPHIACSSSHGDYVISDTQVLDMSSNKLEIVDKCCYPLWLVTTESCSHDNSTDNSRNTQLITGDIIKWNPVVGLSSKSNDVGASKYTEDAITNEGYFTVIRLSDPSYLLSNLPSKEDSQSNLLIDSVQAAKYSPPVLPVKKSSFISKPVSVVINAASDTVATIAPPEYEEAEYPHTYQLLPGLTQSTYSTKTVPPIPPRSNNSLLSSFIENQSNIDDQDLNQSVTSTGGMLPAPISMSASFPNHDSIIRSAGRGRVGKINNFMPKLGKTRLVTIKMSRSDDDPISLQDLGLVLVQVSNPVDTGNNSAANDNSSGSGLSSNHFQQQQPMATTTVFISEIYANSPAAQAELCIGDEILSINNQPINKLLSASLDNSTSAAMTTTDSAAITAGVTSLNGINHVLTIAEFMFVSSFTNPNFASSSNNRRFYLLIKVQFNPIKMAEMCNMKSIFLNQSAYETASSEFPSNQLDGHHSRLAMISSIHGGNTVSKRYYVIRKSSSHDTVVTTTTSNSFYDDIHTHSTTAANTHPLVTRKVKLADVAMVQQIKIIGGAKSGIFISSIEYSPSESSPEELPGNRTLLRTGDRILMIGSKKLCRGQIDSNGDDCNGDDDECDGISNADQPCTIGEHAIELLNQMTLDDYITVIYDNAGLERVQMEVNSQESFYIECRQSLQSILHYLATGVMLSSSPQSAEGARATKTRIHGNYLKRAFSMNAKLDRHTSSPVSMTRLRPTPAVPGTNGATNSDNQPITGQYLDFACGDILFVDSTILPANYIENAHKINDQTITVWHAWKVDPLTGNRSAHGFIPSLASIHCAVAASAQRHIDHRATVSSPTASVRSYGIHTHQYSLPIRYRNSHKSLSNTITTTATTNNASNLADTSYSLDEDSQSNNAGINKQHPLVVYQPIKRHNHQIANEKLVSPVIVIGGHAETLAMLLVQNYPNIYQLGNFSDWTTPSIDRQSHRISIGSFNLSNRDSAQNFLEKLTEIVKNVVPFVIVLNYKCSKSMRRLRISRTTQIKIDKSVASIAHKETQKLLTDYRQLIGAVSIDMSKVTHAVPSAHLHSVTSTATGTDSGSSSAGPGVGVSGSNHSDHHECIDRLHKQIEQCLTCTASSIWLPCQHFQIYS